MNRNYPVGARVRSYDFPTRVDCYIEGRVLAVNDFQYRIQVDTVVIEGQPKPTDGTRVVTPPVNGLEGMYGPTHGVVLADQDVFHAAAIPR